MDDVEDHLAVVDLDIEVDEVPGVAVAPPDPEVTLGTHLSQSLRGAPRW